MVAPAVAILGLNALAGVGTSYSNYRATKRATDYAQAFYNGAYHENKRFFADYISSHHWHGKRTIKYPYRSGYNYNLSPMFNAGVRKVSSQNGVYSALARATLPLGYSNGGYRGSGRPVMMPMYGYW